MLVGILYLTDFHWSGASLIERKNQHIFVKQKIQMTEKERITKQSSRAIPEKKTLRGKIAIQYFQYF